MNDRPWHCSFPMNLHGRTKAHKQRYYCPRCGTSLSDSDRSINALPQCERVKLYDH